MFLMYDVELVLTLALAIYKNPLYSHGSNVHMLVFLIYLPNKDISFNFQNKIENLLPLMRLDAHLILNNSTLNYFYTEEIFLLTQFLFRKLLPKCLFNGCCCAQFFKFLSRQCTGFVSILYERKKNHKRFKLFMSKFQYNLIAKPYHKSNIRLSYKIITQSWKMRQCNDYKIVGGFIEFRRK